MHDPPQSEARIHPTDAARSVLAADIPPYPPAHYEGPEFDALVEDIRVRGVIQPLVLSARGNLIDGYRRLLACDRLGIDRVPVAVSEAAQTEDQEFAAIFATETRSPRSFVNLAEMVHKFSVAHGLSGKEIARRLHLPESKVCNLLSFAEANDPPDVKAMFASGLLSLQHSINATVRLKPEDRVEALRDAAAKGLSANKLGAKAKQKRNVQKKTLSIEDGGVVLSFPSDMPAGLFRERVGALIVRVKDGLKAVNKTSLPMREVLGR